MMKVLAKAGFTQSYTYFTWRNDARELAEYLAEITSPPVAEYFRGNLWPNTPDILHATLVRGGRPAFKLRLVLAATLSSVYGIYSGYELCENVPVAPTSEEYLNSEKYEVRVRDWEAPGNLVDFITRVNTIRRKNAALQEYRNLRFYRSDSPDILWYGKATAARDNLIFVAANLDPTVERDSMVEVPIGELGIAPSETYKMHELLSDRVYEWQGARNFVKLYPGVDPAQIFRLERTR
jgi:starch synthase (maltosyl-transferring)